MEDKPSKLTIEVLPDGQVQVNGPIQNKLLCYGMLECAKDAIREFNEKAQKRSNIVVPMPRIGVPH